MPFLAHPQHGTSVDAPVPLPPTLQVLDVAGALALMDGSKELYHEIAHAYLQALDPLPAEATRQLQQPDLAPAMRTLHTFKGLSLTVGALAMAQACRQCELQTKAALASAKPLGEAVCKRMVDGLQAAALSTRQALLLALQATNSPLQAPSESTALLTQDAVADLQAIRNMLLQSDLHALELFSALRVRQGASHSHLEKLDLALSAFDFAEAVVQ
jgi:HPt (histidine-containing phosphotransfer) domain-containing protein